jgi:hypothetical protein
MEMVRPPNGPGTLVDQGHTYIKIDVFRETYPEDK